MDSKAMTKEARRNIVEALARNRFGSDAGSGRSFTTSDAGVNDLELFPPVYRYDERGMNRDALTDASTNASSRRFHTGQVVNLRRGDSLFFYFGTTLVGELTPSAGGDLNDVLPIDLLHDRLTSVVPDNTSATGIEAWYAIVREFERLTSAPLNLAVDFAPPGGIPDKSGTPPGGFPPGWRDRQNDTLPAIVPLTLPVVPGTTFIEIPVWENMTAGDVVTVRWGSVSLPPRTVGENDLGLPFRVPVPGSVPATPSPKSVTYDITDRLGNFSGVSKEQLDGGGIVPPEGEVTLDFEQADDQTVAPPSGFIDLWANGQPKPPHDQANKLMQVTFDNNGFTHRKDVTIDVHQSSLSKPGQYGGRLLTIGNPQFAGLEVRAFLTLAQAWTTVSFYVTSVDNPLEIHFQDATGNTLYKRPVSGGDVTVGHLVSYTASSPTIKRISIRCKEVIRLDHFTFKGRAP